MAEPHGTGSAAGSNTVTAIWIVLSREDSMSMWLALLATCLIGAGCLAIMAVLAEIDKQRFKNEQQRRADDSDRWMEREGCVPTGRSHVGTTIQGLDGIIKITEFPDGSYHFDLRPVYGGGHHLVFGRRCADWIIAQSHELPDGENNTYGQDDGVLKIVKVKTGYVFVSSTWPMSTMSIVVPLSERGKLVEALTQPGRD